MYPQILPLLKKDPKLVDANDPLMESNLSSKEQTRLKMLSVVRNRLEDLLQTDTIKDGQRLRKTLIVPINDHRAAVTKRVKGSGGPMRPTPLEFEDDLYVEEHPVYYDEEQEHDDDPYEHEPGDPDHVTLLIPPVGIIDEDGDYIP